MGDELMTPESIRVKGKTIVKPIIYGNSSQVIKKRFFIESNNCSKFVFNDFTLRPSNIPCPGSLPSTLPSATLLESLTNQFRTICQITI